MEVALANGRYEDESLRRRKDGSIFWASVLITPIRDLSGNLTGFAKVVRDITERKASEQRFHESERLATLGTTAAVFAHEIANPLNGLSTSLQIVSDLLDDADYDNPTLRETIHGANQEILRLTSLLGDYRSLARPQTINIRARNLRQIVEEVLAPSINNYKNSGITVSVEFDGNLPLVPLDPEKMKQVILSQGVTVASSYQVTFQSGQCCCCSPLPVGSRSEFFHAFLLVARFGAGPSKKYGVSDSPLFLLCKARTTLP